MEILNIGRVIDQDWKEKKNLNIQLSISKIIILIITIIIIIIIIRGLVSCGYVFGREFGRLEDKKKKKRLTK